MIEPATEADLAEALAGAKGPVHIRGGGTRPIGRPVEGEVLSTSAMSGIELYEPGALTIVARAGTPLAEVEAALAGENQRLAFEPMDHRSLLGTTGTPTIGGVVAGNVSGPRRIQAGACRDSLIGVRFVDGAGHIIKNGGRVMKNVTGYDLVKLICGSWGTLGVLSEVSFKVLPATKARAVLLIEGLDNAAAVVTMSKALASPFEVSGAAHLPVGLDGAPVTMLRLEGFEASVAYRAGALKKLLGLDAAIEEDPKKTAAGWRYIRDVEGAPKKGDIWRLSVQPSKAPQIAKEIGASWLQFDWGGGLIWAGVDAGTDLRARLGAFGGHATLIRAEEDTRRRIPVFQPEPAPIAQVTAGLRAKFDPRRILNHGLMG